MIEPESVGPDLSNDEGIINVYTKYLYVHFIGSVSLD